MKTEDYWEDPDTLPAEVIMVMMTEQVAALLQLFGTGGEKLLNEVKQRCNFHHRFWKVLRCSVTDKFTDVDRFKRMVDIYKEDLWQQSNTMRPTSESDSLWHLQVFLDKIGMSKRFSKSICKFLDDHFAVGGPVALALARECVALQTLEAVLPKESHLLVKASQAFDALEEMSSKITSGKNILIAHVSEVLGSPIMLKLFVLMQSSSGQVVCTGSAALQAALRVIV